MTKTIATQGLDFGARNAAQALRIVLLLVIVATPSARAQTYTLLYSFTGGADGGNPYASLVGDTKGSFYGTSQGGILGYGVVFKLDTNDKETPLHSFRGLDGLLPYAGLVRDGNGNLYGTTEEGGSGGFGVVFELSKSGAETVLHNFKRNKTDGAVPYAGLIRDKAGNLYGATTVGGAFDRGVVFKLNKLGKETVLHSFKGTPDGEYPEAGLVRDACGNLYGTTTGDGTSNYGTVFKVTPKGNETVLYRFSGGADGKSPYGGLVLDAAGTLFGSTAGGGLAGCDGNGTCGTVFKIDATGKHTVLYSFTGGADGGTPVAGLIRDAAGNLYGTTAAGGDFGYGTIFKIGIDGGETVLHSFSWSDGANPFAGLIRDKVGNLYGTTYYGGASGKGTVFKLQP